MTQRLRRALERLYGGDGSEPCGNGGSDSYFALLSTGVVLACAQEPSGVPKLHHHPQDVELALLWQRVEGGPVLPLSGAGAHQALAPSRTLAPASAGGDAYPEPYPQGAEMYWSARHIPVPKRMVDSESDPMLRRKRLHWLVLMGSSEAATQELAVSGAMSALGHGLAAWFAAPHRCEAFVKGRVKGTTTPLGPALAELSQLRTQLRAKYEEVAESLADEIQRQTFAEMLFLTTSHQDRVAMIETMRAVPPTPIASRRDYHATKASLRYPPIVASWHGQDARQQTQALLAHSTLLQQQLRVDAVLFAPAPDS